MLGGTANLKLPPLGFHVVYGVEDINTLPPPAEPGWLVRKPVSLPTIIVIAAIGLLAMATDSISAVFRLDTDTKNTRRFEEVVEIQQDGETVEVPAEGIDQHAVGTLYVQKERLEAVFDQLPDRVQITITVPDDA